jgi:hypothetical protein
MKRLLIAAGLAIAMLVGVTTASAQIIPPGTSPLTVPLPPPPPPPKIQVPVIPKLDELPTRNYLPAPRPSFSDKITTCLEEGAAAGLGPGDRETYSRTCANSR